MARGFTINIKGLKETIAKLDREGEEIKKQIDFAIGINSEAMASEAKNRVPVDTGRLKNSITASKMKPYLYEVVAQTNYAAYVEFGTGTGFVPPENPEWSKLASQFKGAGIKQVNLLPRPYMRPSILAYYPKFKEEAIKIIRSKKK
jgi:HK97 gp10 family phage protein